MTSQSPNNVIQSPTAWKTKGDDYNRNPVGTGPYMLKSWTAGDRMVLERIRTTGTRAIPISTASC